MVAGGCSGAAGVVAGCSGATGVDAGGAGCSGAGWLGAGLYTVGAGGAGLTETEVTVETTGMLTVVGDGTGYVLPWVIMVFDLHVSTRFFETDDTSSYSWLRAVRDINGRDLRADSSRFRLGVHRRWSLLGQVNRRHSWLGLDGSDGGCQGGSAGDISRLRADRVCSWSWARHSGV